MTTTAMVPQRQGQALTRPRQDMRAFGEFLRSRQTAMAAVAAKHLDPERVTRIVLGCVAKTPKLQECSVQSIVRSVMQSVELGLEPGSALGQAYLVPFGNECTLIIGYRGLIALMRRSGEVMSISAHAAFVGDEWDYELGDTERIYHKPCGETDPAKLTHAYAIVRLKDGGIQRAVLTRREIETVRARSRMGNSGAWVTDYVPMAVKTAVRRVANLSPMSSEMAKALAADEAADTGDTSGLMEFDTPEAQASVSAETTTADQGTPAADPTERVRQRVRTAAQKAEAEPRPPAPEPPVSDNDEPDPFSDDAVETFAIPPYDAPKVASLFATEAVVRGRLAAGAKSMDITALRDRLLPELGSGAMWSDVTEELYQLLMQRLYA